MQWLHRGSRQIVFRTGCRFPSILLDSMGFEAGGGAQKGDRYIIPSKLEPCPLEKMFIKFCGFLMNIKYLGQEFMIFLLTNSSFKWMLNHPSGELDLFTHLDYSLKERVM